ncbi:hypothetical protein V9T40_005041 [Parthenolecanium corni]|uniref:Uncharacterized protein n=1 Tax=Parthenolecanium corni TaxID=536013 RepID=A0AAN9THF4_9HEMI
MPTEVDQSDFKAKRSLAASSETIVIDRSKCTSTPFNSKIPVLHPRSDPLYYEEPRREQGLKPVNDNSLKKICSNSKIPVSTRRPSNRRVLREPFTPFVQNYHRRPPEMDRAPPRRNDKGVAPGRYTHVKSKLAAYINRPTKMDVLKSSQSKSPNDRRSAQDNSYQNFCGIKRISSRTSLDTYTCEYKTPLPDLNCSDCAKTEDMAKNHQRAREHFELALEHNRIKMENEKIVAEHRRMVSKHRQLMLEHEEKANEHTLKAIAHVLNRIT